MINTPPPPLGASWKSWAERLNRFIIQTANKMPFKDNDAVLSQNGVFLWDEEKGYPVVSKDNEWRQVVLADGEAFLINNSDLTASAIDTEQQISWTGTYSGLTVNGSSITFDEAGTYYLSFSAQAYSTNSSAVTFYFYPLYNGTQVASGATRAVLTSNGHTQPVTKSAVFTVNAGDEIKACWAVSSTSGSLKAFSATAFAPATPSVTLSIHRIKG
jgi:hypothetical protein